MTKICEYLQYADYFTHIIKKEEPAWGRKNWLNIKERLWGTSASNHCFPFKAQKKWNGVKLLKHDNFTGCFFSRKGGNWIIHINIVT